MNKNIRNIIFDWGGVLIDLDIEGCIRGFEEAGVPDVRNLLTGTNELGFFREYECGQMSTAEFRDAIRRATGKPIDDGTIDRLWNKELVSIPEEKLQLLADLSKSYRLFLLSNTNELHWNYGAEKAFMYQGNDLKTLFEEIFLSFRIRLAKPDPEIFRYALEKARLAPEETLFIDDAETNCRAAMSTGMQAVHYVPGTDLRNIFR